MDYTKLSILEVAKLLREGKVTSVELTKQAIAVAEEKEFLGALTTLFKEDALKKAEEIDEMFKAGKELPLLAGIPITIKDNINMVGKNTTCSSKFLENFVGIFTNPSIYILIKNNNNILMHKKALLWKISEYCISFPDTWCPNFKMLYSTQKA